MKTHWIITAESFIGLKEVSNKNDHPLLTEGWARRGLRWLIGQPWCGLFVAHCLQTYPKNFYRAKEWLNWGVLIEAPVYGCVVVFGRTGGGHVGFVVGKDKQGRLLVLGGNQNNAVNVLPFDTGRVLGYRVPYGYKGAALVTVVSNAKSSTNEA